MKIIIISIFALFLFSCLDGQDGLFGTNGKIGCVENSDCETDYICEKGKCISENTTSPDFICNPVTNEGCTGSELCYLYFAGTTARAVCDATLERSVAENSSCDYLTDSICDTGLGCSSANKCKKLCSGNCDTPRCTGYGNHSGTEVGLCDY